MLTTGEVRSEMAKELGESLEHVINTHVHLDEYYILIVARWEGDGVMRTKIIPMFKKDVPKIPLMNTICYFIDNRSETFRQEWCLPMDPEIPESAVKLLSAEAVETVLRSSKLLDHRIAKKIRKMH